MFHAPHSEEEDLSNRLHIGSTFAYSRLHSPFRTRDTAARVGAALALGPSRRIGASLQAQCTV